MRNLPTAQEYYSDAEILINKDLNWNQFMDSTIVVTGATGFLGKYLVHTLLAIDSFHLHGIKIMAIVRDLDYASKIYGDLEQDPRLEFIKHDLTSSKEILIKTQINFIIHAASIATPKEFVAHQRETLLPNVTGTINLLRLAEKSSNFKGFLYLSSSEVYGESDSLNPIKEEDLGKTDIFNPRSVYAESKRAGELICRVWERSSNLPIAIARPFHTYGIGLKPGDGRAFADFIDSALNGGNIVITGDGSATRAYCHAIDAVEGFLRILTATDVGGTYNVGNPFGIMTILELAELIAESTNKSKVIFKKIEAEYASTQSPNRALVPDISRLQSLGWNPTITPLEGFGRIINGA